MRPGQSTCEIRGGQNGTKTDFSRVLRLFPANIIPPFATHSQCITWGIVNGPLNGPVPDIWSHPIATITRKVTCKFVSTPHEPLLLNFTLTVSEIL